jgi:hypothetical protein
MHFRESAVCKGLSPIPRYRNKWSMDFRRMRGANTQKPAEDFKGILRYRVGEAVDTMMQ